MSASTVLDQFQRSAGPMSAQCWIMSAQYWINVRAVLDQCQHLDYSLIQSCLVLDQCYATCTVPKVTREFSGYIAESRLENVKWNGIAFSSLI